jgi:hypothetical protein
MIDNKPDDATSVAARALVSCRWQCKPPVPCPTCGADCRTRDGLAAHKRENAACQGKVGRPRKCDEKAE